MENSRFSARSTLPHTAVCRILVSKGTEKRFSSPGSPERPWGEPTAPGQGRSETDGESVLPKPGDVCSIDRASGIRRPELPEAHDQKLTVMLTATELEMLREVAEAEGVNMSDVVRKCIREKHARLVKQG